LIQIHQVKARRRQAWAEARSKQTGSDAPTLSTLYLDKPMREHSLMQSIARANRVTSHQIHGVPKTNGEIIYYYNVFRHMQQPLAHYALGDEGNMPVQDKFALFSLPSSMTPSRKGSPSAKHTA
jgi:hypothetical protein